MKTEQTTQKNSFPDSNDNAAEEARQMDFIRKDAECVSRLNEHLGRKPKFHVSTFGCQMNARDSEKLRGILIAVGYEEAKEEDADFVIYNTCTVRENADQHVYGRLGLLNRQKKEHPSMKIALCGCMMQEEQIVNKIKKSYPFVDLIFGTHNLFAFPELLYRMLTDDNKVTKILESTKKIVENLPVERTYKFKSGVNIMYGCDNFCSYCIVPYVRGRERSRLPDEILDEVERLVADGVEEVMFLGQNVNSYGKTLKNPVSFAELLSRAAKTEGLNRIRFMTSHPKDLSDELIDTIAENKNICRHIHLPVQSGSTEILKKMNRHYTREDYLLLVEKIRKRIPDVSLTTDIIVGFPGETEGDFEDTLSLIRACGFDNAFTFEYSKRTGTPAAAMENQVPSYVVKDRFKRLLDTVKTVGYKACGRFQNTVQDVLIEEKNRTEGLVTGRMASNLVVHVKGNEDMIGKIVPVRMTDCMGFYYLGVPEETEGW